MLDVHYFLDVWMSGDSDLLTFGNWNWEVTHSLFRALANVLPTPIFSTPFCIFHLAAMRQTLKGARSSISIVTALTQYGAGLPGCVPPVHVNSASYPLWDSKLVVAYELQGEGLYGCMSASCKRRVQLIADTGSGLIHHCSIISLCQSAAIFEIVKRFWSQHM